MDILPLAGMLFSLLVVLIIAGSILTFPIMRRLGKLLEMRIEERRQDGPQAGRLESAELDALREIVEGLQTDVDRLAERQAFAERLLERGREESKAP